MATADVIYPSHSLMKPSLTPRTPRFNVDESQDEPLLQSAASATFPQHQLDLVPRRKRRRDVGKQKSVSNLQAALQFVQRIPLTLVAAVAALLIIIAVLYRRNPKLILQDPSPPSLHYTQEFEEPPSENKNFLDYSSYSSFPLIPLQYAAECWKMHQKPTHHQAYWTVPESGIMDVPHPSSSNECSSTITYQLDSHSGLFAQLAIMAQVAALARERGRTLFIDDKFWNRGKWTDHFEDVRITQSGPEPGCKPPSPKELVACPRLARHWIVNSQTAKFHFSQAFENEYHDPYGHGIDRLRPVFESGRDSLSELIVPNAQNKELIATARQVLGSAPFIGIHIRRGDHKAMSWKYHGGHVPLADYLQAMTSIGHLTVQSPPVNVWIASDDAATAKQYSEMLPEGFAAFSLGSLENRELHSLTPSQPYNQSTWNGLDRDARIRETRGVIVDFAVISGAWDGVASFPEAVICTMTSNICTMSAMSRGWNHSFIEQKWVEIDNGGSIEPIWKAYSLF